MYWDDFVIENKVGEGSFAKVFKIFNLRNEKVYALKEILLQEKNIEKELLPTNLIHRNLLMPLSSFMDTRPSQLVSILQNDFEENEFTIQNMKSSNGVYFYMIIDLCECSLDKLLRKRNDYISWINHKKKSNFIIENSDVQNKNFNVLKDIKILEDFNDLEDIKNQEISEKGQNLKNFNVLKDTKNLKNFQRNKNLKNYKKNNQIFNINMIQENFIKKKIKKCSLCSTDMENEFKTFTSNDFYKLSQCVYFKQTIHVESDHVFINSFFCANIFKDIVRGVLYLHKNKIVHFDLKSNNILLTLENNKITPKICDYGLREKKLNVESDIMALGLIYFEMLLMCPTVMEIEIEKNNLKTFGVPSFQFSREYPIESKVIKWCLRKCKRKSIDTQKLFEDMIEICNNMKSLNVSENNTFHDQIVQDIL